MNWTGGTLQRTKHANKGVVQKQKAYFARARTHLQNGSNPTIAPFRPSYLQNDDSFELAGRLPSFGSGSVRHTGHSARRHREARDREPSPNDDSHEPGEYAQADIEYDMAEASNRPAQFSKSPRRMATDGHRLKRKAENADEELQLLEANRKRLLQQSDWTGVAPSRPVNLRFMSSREKNKVGRRRKIEEKRGAAIRHRDHTGFAMPPMHAMDDLPTGATRFNPNDIRIRIGTDALTTACSTQPGGHNESHASSEPMLFDQQNHDVSGEGSRDTVCTGTPVRETTPEACRSLPNRQVNLPDEPTQIYRSLSPPLEPNTHHRDPGQFVTYQRNAPGSARDSLPKTVSDRNISAVRIMQHVEGVEHPFRLVFGSSAISSYDRGCNTSQRDIDSVPAAHAGVSPKGSIHHFGSGPELESEDATVAAAGIVDDKPWKSLLDIPTKSSSQTTTSFNPRKSIVQHDHTERRREAEGASWSQHATQGNEPCSSSLISASLSSPKRHPHARTIERTVKHRNGTIPRQLTEDEERWENFIFGSRRNSSSTTRNQRGESSASRARQDSSGYLPLSAAVSSLSSTPFRSTWRPPCTSDSIHSAASFAPQSGSRMISSPAATPAGFVEELSDDEQGIETTERSACGDQTVTLSSMQNNTSGETDLISSRMFSSTQASGNGLKHPVSGATGLLGRAQPSTSQTGRKVKRPCVYDIPDSDDGIEVVDRDRL